MYIFQGWNDRMFPADEFRQVARRAAAVYERLGAPDALRAELLPGTHGWDRRRRGALTRFLVGSLSLPVGDAVEPARERLLSAKDTCLPVWPDRALDTDGLAAKLSGKAVQRGLKLWDVFTPAVAPQALGSGGSRDEIRQILAQFEAFLGGRWLP
jgi:hypothetical protein